jgi:transcriptional regulator with XRE-family HTH domain
MAKPKEPDELKIFGLTVRDFRKRSNMSQERLAELAELHRTYIGDIERGKRNVSLKNILKIAKALKVKPSSLISRFDSEQ